MCMSGRYDIELTSRWTLMMKPWLHRPPRHRFGQICVSRVEPEVKTLRMAWVIVVVDESPTSSLSANSTLAETHQAPSHPQIPRFEEIKPPGLMGFSKEEVEVEVEVEVEERENEAMLSYPTCIISRPGGPMNRFALSCICETLLCRLGTEFAEMLTAVTAMTVSHHVSPYHQASCLRLYNTPLQHASMESLSLSKGNHHSDPLSMFMDSCEVVTQLSTTATEIDLDDVDPDTRAYTGIGQVVCKLSLHEKGSKLKHEASVYEQLKLGDRMPHFFGLYESESDGTGICCLILEYCGISLAQKGNLLDDQKEKFRKGCSTCRRMGASSSILPVLRAANACTATARDDPKKPLDEEEIMKYTSPHVWLEIDWDRVKLLVQQAIADYEQKILERLVKLKRQEDDTLKEV
ncbi:hypothetical protein C8Q72DRAFT_947101 [Fomitopsis betulina]|nr:hypothetical protein C8Q72DRAFT_947347 [Fomitopsis betulina]KAI0721172.1 hypothetical protein C8Q72DRAFT_947101 [Fomitopsis betulina]